MNSCKKFGVTFHKNMDLTTLVNQWNKVSEQDRNSEPEFNNIMKSAEILLEAQALQIQVTESAKQALNTITELTTVASAALTGNGAYVGTKATEVAADASQSAQNATVEAQQQLVFDQLCE